MILTDSNTQFTIRSLTSKDETEISRICSLHNKFLRTKEHARSIHPSDHFLAEAFDETKTLTNVWGAFDSTGSLRSFLISKIRENGLYYTLHHVKSDPQMGGMDKSGLPFVWNHCLSYHEALGIYRFFFSRSASSWPQQKVAHKFYEKAPLFNRYTRVIEAVVKAGNLTTHPFFNNLLGNKVWSHDIAIEHVFLKQKFRPDSDLLLEWM
jgi:hypothetical protein